mmetsp:Transcript_71733/g.142235  ORF Transcript_71733/g.142235 Transcript_71733/m.142235 type:complete len:100 (-) Transcript_71733:152-451(-)
MSSTALQTEGNVRAARKSRSKSNQSAAPSPRYLQVVRAYVDQIIQPDADDPLARPALVHYHVIALLVLVEVAHPPLQSIECFASLQDKRVMRSQHGELR